MSGLWTLSGLGAWGLACAPGAGTTADPVETDSPPHAALAAPRPLGDPVVTLSTDPLTDGVHEATHLAPLDDDHALVVARRGVAVAFRDGRGQRSALYDRESFSRVAVDAQTGRGFGLDTDGGVTCSWWSVSSPGTPTPGTWSRPTAWSWSACPSSTGSRPWRPPT